MYKRLAQSVFEHIAHIILLSIFMILVGCGPQFSPGISDDTTNRNPNMIIGSLLVNTNTRQFNNVDMCEEEINDINTNDWILKQIIISNNIILVSNSFLVVIKEALSTFIASNRNEYIIKSFGVPHDSIEGSCYEFDRLCTIGDWIIEGTPNVVTAYYYYGFGNVYVIFNKKENAYQNNGYFFRQF